MTQPQPKAGGGPTSAPAGARQAAPGSQVVVEHISPVRAAIRRFFRHRLAIVGLVIIAFVLFTAIFADYLTTWNPNFVDLDVGSRVAPSSAHILGTDVSGRDIFSRTVYGGRTSLIVGFGAVSVYLVVGTARSLAWRPVSTAASWTWR
jgi:peptide/nickel transport system permease protein